MRQLKRIILASASPRRRDLLSLLGLNLEVFPSHIQESSCHGDPALRAMEVAREKLAHVRKALEADFDGVCLAADTVVALGEKAFGKPAGKEEARNMLRELAGKTHTVFTAFRLEDGAGNFVEETVGTEVEMLAFSEIDLDWYLSVGESFDKAGGYGIQSAGGAFVKAIHGSYSNVIGLPLAEVRQGLIRLGALGEDA